MFKRKLYEKIKDKLGYLLYGFDESKLDSNFFTGMVKLTDLIFRPDRVNEILDNKNSPFQLKAGIVSSVNIKVSRKNSFLIVDKVLRMEHLGRYCYCTVRHRRYTHCTWSAYFAPQFEQRHLQQDSRRKVRFQRPLCQYCRNAQTHCPQAEGRGSQEKRRQQRAVRIQAITSGNDAPRTPGPP